MKTWHYKDYRFQIYWPFFRFVKKRDLFIKLDTNLRVIWNLHNIYGIGVSILGFGCGVDYEKSMVLTPTKKCEVPPKGWWCSREAGHEGPCAARPIEN